MVSKYLFYSTTIIITISLSPDIIFFIFLYQRWIYPVDKKRVNEFGQGGDDDGAAAPADAGAGAGAGTDGGGASTSAKPKED